MRKKKLERNNEERYLIVDGERTSQTPGVVDVLKKALLLFGVVIQTGAFRRGFTHFLNQNKKEGGRLVSYGIEDNCLNEDIVKEIKEAIDTPTRVIVLCNTEYKKREFQTYAPFLKKGDVIMCYYYRDTDEDWWEITEPLNMSPPYTPWKSEISYDDISECIEENNLEEFRYDEFTQVMWGAFIKK